jgi:hypothetical protein
MVKRMATPSIFTPLCYQTVHNDQTGSKNSLFLRREGIEAMVDIGTSYNAPVKNKLLKNLNNVKTGTWMS